jgi:hypothetical protein
MEALVELPIVGATARSDALSATVSPWLFGGDVSLVLLDAPAVRVSTSVGVAAAWLRVTGTASPPYSAHATSAWTVVPLAGLGIAPRLTDHVHLPLGAAIGVSLPKAEIALAGESVATWGRPLGLLSGGLDVDF